VSITSKRLRETSLVVDDPSSTLGVLGEVTEAWDETAPPELGTYPGGGR